MIDGAIVEIEKTSIKQHGKSRNDQGKPLAKLSLLRRPKFGPALFFSFVDHHRLVLCLCLPFGVSRGRMFGSLSVFLYQNLRHGGVSRVSHYLVPVFDGVLCPRQGIKTRT